MKVLVIGGGGMLGHKLVQQLNKKFDVWTTLRTNFGNYENYQIFKRNRTLDNINIERIEMVEQAIKQIKPSVIINAVGVIKQLPTAKDVIKTLSVNSIFPHHLAELAQNYNARLITISTDCVFSGKKGHYSENDISDAEDLYGKSKNLGEVVAENCLTIRTSIIGRELSTSHSLVEWFLSNKDGYVKGFVNAIFSGFPSIILTDIISGLIEKHPQLNGLYHISSEPINKFRLLELIREAYRVNIEIEPSEDFVIDRSLDSTKFREATSFQPINWTKMIDKMAADNAPYKLRN